MFDHKVPYVFDHEVPYVFDHEIFDENRSRLLAVLVEVSRTPSGNVSEFEPNSYCFWDSPFGSG